MTVSGHGIEAFVHDVTSYVLGYGRAYSIHGQFRSLQDLQWARCEVLKGANCNITVADPLDSRCIAGLLNGNMGVAKSMLGELTDSTNRAQASGLLPLTWAVGVTIGYATLRPRCTQFSLICNSPLAGGTLSRPHERFPTLFGNWFWEEYPYLLPCLFSTVFCTLCFVLTWVFLKEVRGFAGGLAKESDRPLPI